QPARAVLDDRGLYAGCRSVPQIQAIYSAVERGQRCIDLRTDATVHEYADTSELKAALIGATPGTLAVLSLGDLAKLSPRLKALSINGVPADDRSFSDETYPLARRIYLYLPNPTRNRASAADVHRLLRMADAVTNEEMVGPGGVLSAMGLVPLPQEERARQRERVMGLLTTRGGQ
ncbi:MAG: hypothetical protein K2X44_04060, partial [Magnetospirillum sp.]|nr:hypothetical protein [Magnetospirillum sp.]